MKTILTICFSLLLLISCNTKKEKPYPWVNISIDTSNNIENKVISTYYKDSSTMATIAINLSTKEKDYESFSCQYYDSVRTLYYRLKLWQIEEEINDYYYSLTSEIDYSNSRSSIRKKYRVTLMSKKKLSFEERTKLVAWPMNQLQFIGEQEDSIVKGSFVDNFAFYEYLIIPKRNDTSWIWGKGEARIILKNTNDTIGMRLAFDKTKSSRDDNNKIY